MKRRTVFERNKIGNTRGTTLTDGTGNASRARNDRERSIGRFDQSPSKCDSLGLVGFKQRLGPATENGSNFPSEIRRIADSRVHALAAHRAMNMCGIAQQKSTTFPKTVRDAMVDAVGREPIYTFDLDAQTIDDVFADIVSRRVLGSCLVRLPARCQ
jgi:hypothetical protein